MYPCSEDPALLQDMRIRLLYVGPGHPWAKPLLDLPDVGVQGLNGSPDLPLVGPELADVENALLPMEPVGLHLCEMGAVLQQ